MESCHGDHGIQHRTQKIKTYTGPDREKPKNLAAGRVGKLQGITLCLLVGQDSVWPGHLPPLQLRGAHLAGLGQGQGGHLGLGAGRGAAGHAGQVLLGQRDTQPM